MLLIYAVFWNNPEYLPWSEQIFPRNDGGKGDELCGFKKPFTMVLIIHLVVCSLSGAAFLKHMACIKRFVWSVVFFVCTFARWLDVSFEITAVHHGHLKISISKLNHMCLVLHNRSAVGNQECWWQWGSRVEDWKWRRGDVTSLDRSKMMWSLGAHCNH